MDNFADNNPFAKTAENNDAVIDQSITFKELGVIFYTMEYRKIARNLKKKFSENF
jgi:hypothetical protein